MAIVLVLAIFLRIKMLSFRDEPSGLQNFLEFIVETMENFTKSTIGKELAGLDAYFFGVFAVILLSNYSGLFGLRPPTADLSTTLALALTTFAMIHILGIRNQKGKYFKEYLEPVPLFLPMNIIGELSKPISLSFRLFGNMLGGYIIMRLVYALLPRAFTFLLPSVLHFYFDLFAGALQAFIFVVLSMTFIQQKASID